MGPIIRAMNHNRTRVVLIVLEIAMTLAIVTNCVNVILAERAKMSQASGFDDANIVRLNVRPFAQEFRDQVFFDQAVDQDLRTIRSVAGVRAAANTHFQLWEGGGSSSGYFVPGEVKEPIATQEYFATRDIVQALGAELVEGRGFIDSDFAPPGDPGTGTKVILTKRVADMFFPDGHAVGRQVVGGEPGKPEGEPVTVVGVIRDFYNPFGTPTSLSELSDRGLFRASRVGGYNGGMAYLIRCEPGTMTSVMANVEKRLAQQNGGRVFEWMPTMTKKTRWFSSASIVVTTMSCIIIAIIAVTSLGLLGLTSLSVAERTKQIGTRRALGATRADILSHFLVENWLITTAGLAIGAIGAYALNFLLVSHVSEVKMHWQLVAAGMVLLWINGLLSTIPPAMRATMVSPSIATRSV